MPTPEILLRSAVEWRDRAGIAFGIVRRHPATPRIITGVLALMLVAVAAVMLLDVARDDTQPRNIADLEARHARELAAERRHAAEADVKHGVELDAIRRELAELRDQIVKASLHLADKSRELADKRQELADKRQELADKGQELAKANVAIEELKKQQALRRLSYDEKRTLIAALRPFRGQKISIAAIYGDDDAKNYAEDLVQALDAAGWALDKTGITFQRWNRTPVGVEVTLNEADARAGRVSAGTGALINVVRQMGLVDGNSVFMNPDVPAGEVQLRVGHRLQAAPAAN